MRHARADYNRIQDPAHLIPEDEPVFLIRGQDAVGPETVDHWAFMAEQEGASKEIIVAAKYQAAEMRKWQHIHGLKTPDMPKASI